MTRGPLTYRYLLVGIMVVYVLAIAVPLQSIGTSFRVAILGALLIGASRTRRHAGHLALPVLLAALVLFTVTVVTAVIGDDHALAEVSAGATIVLTLGAIAILIDTLMRRGEVNGATVNGVLCIYLLIALLFGSIDELFALTVSHYVNGADPANTSTMLYYSVITITTVGYGDITPATGLARAVASTEALIGQLYLVSVVAAVVSRYRRT
ncbi:MAG TPA: potassium channel family protein [Micromonosporaceae bacterium]|jgi:hypothetical protein